ncbi:hypothetical protein CYY_004935 [Polysphondylium violaceum]|uniref:Uncharacterized protein n=1 Tax=Polysphondylium violaceum TaxID=133409 RepID=A0A8J4Q4H2_9MYCE|nr:hypothetical protein CYY_004935 [Polysphondylium violaceum]
MSGNNRNNNKRKSKETIATAAETISTTSNNDNDENSDILNLESPLKKINIVSPQKDSNNTSIDNQYDDGDDQLQAPIDMDRLEEPKDIDSDNEPKDIDDSETKSNNSKKKENTYERFRQLAQDDDFLNELNNASNLNNNNNIRNSHNSNNLNSRFEQTISNSSNDNNNQDNNDNHENNNNSNNNQDNNDNEDDFSFPHMTSDDYLYDEISNLKKEWDNKNYGKTPPIILQTVLYATIKDKSDIERNLSILKKKGTIKIFQVLTSLNDYCILLTQDYIKCIESMMINKKDYDPNQSTMKKILNSPNVKTENLPNSVTKSSEPIKSAVDVQLMTKNSVLELFIKNVIPQFQDVFITKQRLQQVLAIKDQHQLENIINVLFNCELLILKEENRYQFRIPGSGGFLSNIMKGRKEIISMINRLQYKEILLKDLLKKKLKYSNITIKTHIKDLSGSGKIKFTPTTQGELIRCVNTEEL